MGNYIQRYDVYKKNESIIYFDTFKSMLKKIINSDLVRSSSVSLLIQSIGSLSALIVQILLARLLGAVEFGDYVLIIAWARTLTIFGVMGADIASVKYVATYSNNKISHNLMSYVSWVINFIKIKITVTISVLLFVLMLIYFMAGLRAELLLSLLIASPLLFILPFIQTYAGILRGFGDITSALLLQRVLYPVVILTVLSVFYLLAQQLSLVTVITINILSGILTVFFYRKKVLGKLRQYVGTAEVLREENKWQDTAYNLAISGGSQVFFKQSDILLVGLMFGSIEAGVYAVASRIIGVLRLGLTSINLAVSHKFSEYFSSNQHNSLQRLATRSAILIVVTIVPLIIISLVWAGPLLSIFGEHYVNGILILKILLVGEVFNALSGPNGVLMNMSNQQKTMAKISVWNLSIGLLLMIILGYFYHLAGIAIAIIISGTIRNIIINIHLWKVLKINTTLVPYHLFLEK